MNIDYVSLHRALATRVGQPCTMETVDGRVITGHLIRTNLLGCTVATLQPTRLGYQRADVEIGADEIDIVASRAA